MPSKRYKKLPEKTKDLDAEVIEKLLPEVKKNCTTKFDESVDLNFQINHKQKMQDLNALDLEQAVKIIAGSARSMGIEVKE